MMLVINPLLTLVTIGVLVVMLVVVKAVGSRSRRYFACSKRLWARSTAILRK